MKQSRRKFTAKFKAMVAVEALKERESLSELATRFEIHPTQVSAWKREFLDRAEKAFGDEPAKEEESVDGYSSPKYATIPPKVRHLFLGKVRH